VLGERCGGQNRVAAVGDPAGSGAIARSLEGGTCGPAHGNDLDSSDPHPGPTMPQCGDALELSQRKAIPLPDRGTGLV